MTTSQNGNNGAKVTYPRVIGIISALLMAGSVFIVSWVEYATRSVYTKELAAKDREVTVSEMKQLSVLIGETNRRINRIEIMLENHSKPKLPQDFQFSQELLDARRRLSDIERKIRSNNKSE